MGQIRDSRVTGMGCNLMGVLFLSRWLPGPGLCKRREHQGQAASWERLPVLLSPRQGCRLEQLWKGGAGHRCPDLESVPVLHFSFPSSSHLPPTHTFLYSRLHLLLFFFQLHSFSCFFLFLSRPFLFRSSFLVLSGPGGPLHFSFLALLEMDFGLSCKQIGRRQLTGG